MLVEQLTVPVDLTKVPIPDTPCAPKPFSELAEPLAFLTRMAAYKNQPLGAFTRSLKDHHWSAPAEQIAKETGVPLEQVLKTATLLHGLFVVELLDQKPVISVIIPDSKKTG